jgi:nucleotide-binding universal stress UspA family protein
MSEYRRVLIPIDLTPGIQMLAPAVRRMIDTGHAEITLLHVVAAQPRRDCAGRGSG